MSKDQLFWELSGDKLFDFINKLSDDELAPYPNELHSVVVELDEPGGDVIGWVTTDIEGNEVADHFMETAFGSLVAGECLMSGKPVEREPETGFKP